MSRPRNIIKKLDSSAVKLVNDNFRQVTEELSLSNFSGGKIDTGTVLITQNIVQAPVVTLEGSDLDGSYLRPASVDADAISVDNLTAISSDLGEATSGSLVVGDTNKLWLNDEGDGGLAIGGSVKATAPFRVDNQGNMLAESATITGEIYSTGGELGGITDADIDVGAYGNIRGGQTDFNTGVGFFIGKSGDAHKFSIGNQTNNMTYDGENLRINGNMALNSPVALMSYTASTLPVVPTAVGYNNASGVE